MKLVNAYQNSTEAVQSLDNGGGFFNFFTKAGDDKITAAEIATVAGVSGGHQKMHLFLEMALHDLGHDERQAVISKLAPKFRSQLDKYSPRKLSPSAAIREGQAGESAIITGYPRFTEDKKVFNGYIMIPIMAGKVMTFMIVPITDRYDIYELRDEVSSETFFLANVRGSEKLPEQKTRFGGILKQAKADKGGKQAGGLFLEAGFFTPLE